ncbi:MAG: DUF1318 domain-containing protein [Deltaproteobacteria bacterium]|nr:DUF1318 domain-containing protein [Deltaproteobacteria bacterium]
MNRLILSTGVCFLCFGCTLAEVQVNVVSERTALENQVLGAYNSLSDEVLLVASVRGVDPTGQIESPPRRSREQQDAVDAIQVMAFNQDDIDAFKRLGWVGEGNEGLLKAFPMETTATPEDLTDFVERYPEPEFKAVVGQVNEARETIMRRVVETDPGLSKDDLPQVRRVFGKLNRENALSGEKIQNEDGLWTEKP